MTQITWHGCHGVRADGDLDGLGAVAGEPLCDATIRIAPVPPGVGQRLWTQTAEVASAHGALTVERSLYRETPARLVVRSSIGPALAVDTERAIITVEPADVWIQRQLVAGLGLPLLLHRQPVLLLHASAVSRAGDALVFCGDSGVGKSTALVALSNGGWSPISEDLCALDLRGETPLLWPGPPWVRLRVGQPGPTGAAIGFEGPDKAGWDIASVQVRAPQVVTRLVLLEPPAAQPRLDPVAPPDVIRSLAAHTTWLAEPEDRAKACFAGAARVAARVPAVRLRVEPGASADAYAALPPVAASRAPGSG